MIKFDFDKILYHRPYFKSRGIPIESIIGIDTETYTDGKPFLICTSLGDAFRPKQFPRCLFSRRYRGKNFGCWNLKFDSGSFIHRLDRGEREALAEFGKVKHGKYIYRYIPHKYLGISKGKHAVKFWDINHFFGMTLQSAAVEYLKKSKIEIETKNFTRAYVKYHRREITVYCIQDAVLVSELYIYLLDGLKQIGLTPTSLYSKGSLAFQFLKSRCKMVGVYRYWKRYRELLRFACESYYGGKFEIYRRGRFNGISYDISSAYPFEMSQLYDINNARVVYSKILCPDADYGFLRVLIDNTLAVGVPSPLKYKNLNIFPAGIFKNTITLAEYNYMVSLGLKLKHLEGYYLYVDSKRRPYKKIIDYLYDQKTLNKDTDLRLYDLYKKMLNSIYGKQIQMIEQPDGSIKAGQGWNPIYASVITANVRIRVTQVYNDNPNNVLSIHTDGVIMDAPLDNRLIGRQIGSWTQDHQGDGVVIACGMYQIGQDSRYRGLHMDNDNTWFDILGRSGKLQVLEIQQVISTSWKMALARGDITLTNTFSCDKKEINLNCERKRVWPGPVDAWTLLNESQISYPRLITPDVFWA
jgi:hypothetical protein